jgi:hypothetical protein
VNPLCIQCVHVGFVIAQPLYVFKTGSAGEDVIGNVQYMIGFPIRRVAFQQYDVLVDRLVQSQFAYEFMHGSYPAKSESANFKPS